ncbi:hypothetical protein, partial [Acinetobacter pittii]|uniref:hypothetical protein n=1 Tax=Acinetobacter pittii TaxID=48296 RepID=UPI0033321200
MNAFIRATTPATNPPTAAVTNTTGLAAKAAFQSHVAAAAALVRMLPAPCTAFLAAIAFVSARV